MEAPEKVKKESGEVSEREDESEDGHEAKTTPAGSSASVYIKHG